LTWAGGRIGLRGGSARPRSGDPSHVRRTAPRAAPIPPDLLPLTDEELLRKIRQSAAGYRFQQLWRGRLLQHRTVAAADLEMCRLLAAWGGPLPERIDRLFRLSGRAMCV
jgi:hypothetical protein